MASASGIRMGKVFVEIGADPAKFFAALQGVQKSIGRVGSAMQSLGTKMAGIGTAFAAPMAGAVVAGSRFEDVLLNMRASTGATAEQLGALKAAAMQMSQALGVGPTEAAQGFLELLKAGMSVEQVLAGAGQAAIQFAKVGDMAVADAAVVMADAMNVFKVTGQVAANTLSAAADASSTSIQGISLAFSQVSAVAALANQSIGDTAAALAVLANAGVKGSDAGTSLKTMLMRLMAPAADAADAMAGIGLSTESFRNADGTIKPMVEIIRTLETALAGMDQAARDDIFRRIFGQDAIRAAAVLTQAGVEGFSAMQQGMSDAMPVGDKFAEMMSGLSGAAGNIFSAIQRLSIAITEALGPSLLALAEPIMNVIGGFATFVQKNQELVASVAKGIAVFTGAGVGLAMLGGSLKFVSGAIGTLATVASTALAPFRLLVAAAAGVGGAFASAVPGISKLAASFGQAIVAGAAFAASAVTAAASYVSSLGLMAAATTARMGFVAATWVATGIAIGAGFLAHLKAMVTYYTGALAGMQAITIARTGAMAAAWVASLGGVNTFGNALKSTLSMSNRVVASTVATIGPAIAFISKGFAAIASDVARLASPLAKPFVRAAGAVAGFATGVASSVATLATGVAASVAAYIGSIASAAAATVKSTAIIAGAWIGNSAKAVGAFVSSVAGSVAAYAGSLAAAVAATVGAAIGIAAAWLSTAFPATAAFVSQAVAKLGVYIASVAASLAASVTSAAGIAVAWVSSGMPGLAAFVGSAVAGIATYLGSCAAAVAGSVASAAAVAAAWLAPAAPIIAIGAAIAGAAAVAYTFGGQLKGALSGVGELAGQAGSAIGTVFSGAVQNASVVFGDLYSTAKTTFTGVYDAIAEGDLAGAMDVLWAGLYAGWLRGVEAIMGVVDPWIASFQAAFTIMGAEIYKGWDALWVTVGNALNTAGAYLMGAFDNIINPILAMWDTLEAGIRKSWNRVQSFFKKGFDLKKENEKVDSEMAANRRKRELERPGIEGRAAKADKENAQSQADMVKRHDAVDAATQNTINGHEDANRKRADERKRERKAAEDNVAGMTRGKRETRAMNDQFARMMEDAQNATTIEHLQDLYQEMDALVANGRLTDGQVQTLEGALEDAQARIYDSARSAGGASPSAQIRGGAGAAAGDSAQSKAEVAGTFSSMALGGMGFGSSIAQKQLDEQKKTNKLLEEGLGAGEVAA